MAATTLNVLFRHNSNPFFTITIFPYILISPVPDSHLLRVRHGFICTKPRYYLYLLLNFLLVFSHSRRRGSVGYPNQYSIYSLCSIPSRKYQTRFLEYFPAKISPYFSKLLISNCKFEITTVP